MSAFAQRAAAAVAAVLAAATAAGCAGSPPASNNRAREQARVTQMDVPGGPPCLISALKPLRAGAVEWAQVPPHLQHFVLSRSDGSFAATVPGQAVPGVAPFAPGSGQLLVIANHGHFRAASVPQPPLEAPTGPTATGVPSTGAGPPSVARWVFYVFDRRSRHAVISALPERASCLSG